MKLINDKQKQLNYHPLVVYIVLSPIEYQEHSNNIESLNDRSELTRGLFKFRAIQQGNKYSSELSNELTATIKKFNVILRLVDDSDGSYNYALDKINLAQGIEMLEVDLRGFVIDACKQNVKFLNKKLSLITNDRSTDIEDAALISAMINSFKDVVNFDRYRKRVSSLTKSLPSDLQWYDDNALSCDTTDLYCGIPMEIAALRDSLYGVLPDRNSKENFKKMMIFFESLMNVSEIDESDKYAQGTVDGSKSEDLKVDLYSRSSYDEHSRISIKITKILPNLQKRVRKVWGFEVSIEENTIPIYMGSIDAAMVYICTLLKQKAGSRLSRDMFRHAIPDRQARNRWHKDVLWIERVYKTLYPGANTDFYEWYKKMKENSAHGVSQGKSAACRIIKTSSKQYSEDLKYCQIKAEEVNRNTTYFVNISVDNIILSQELESLLIAQ